MIAIQPKSRQILGVNQQAYHALKASMSLNLRRQLLVAVCDNVALQNQLATQLETDLAQVNWTPPRGGTDLSNGGSSGGPSGGRSLALERLIFDSEDAHLPRQVAHWVRQTMLSEDSLPQVQVLGIEQMTRQPAIIQNHFLRSLEQVESLLPRLNTSLLVWVPWPWLRTIQSSAPTFWKWRNGVFEFVSDPSPALLESHQLESHRLNPEQRAAQAYPLSHQPLVQSSASGDRDRFTEEMGYLSTGRRSTDRIPAPGDRRAVDRPATPEEYPREEYPHEEYPRIEPHQVVALYGETDDSDFGDYGQPTLETVATWDTVEVVATTVERSVSDERDQEALQSLEATNIEAESSETESPDIAEVELGVKAPSLEAQDLAAQKLDADRLEQARWQAQEQWFAAQRPTPCQPESQSTAESAVVDPSRNSPVQQLEKAPPDVADAQPSSSVSVSSQEQRQRAADGYFEVGRRYRSRIETGERGLDLIEPAIAAYEGALRCLSGPHPDWGSGLNDLGTLYWLKAQQLDDQQQVVDCMSHSMELYSEALEKIDAVQSPDMVCQLHSNLGAVSSMLATQKDPVVHFKQAANAYVQALSFCPLSVDPQEFSTLQNSLGSVYWKLSHYEQDKGQLQVYLQQAITAYQQALLGYSPQERPLDYAAVQNNLGITYWSLAKHINAVSALKNAIAAYRDALNYRTPANDAAACAITYNNLALAYWDLSKDDTVEPEPKRRYQRNAITAFEAALQTANSVGALSKTDSAAIYHCLGDVHAQMVDGAPSTTEIADSLQKSLHSYVQAIDKVSMDSPIFETRLTAITANLRSHKEHLGLASQQAALNRVPSHLISLVMQSL